MQIRTLTLMTAVAWVAGVEIATAWWFHHTHLSALTALGLARLIQIIGLVWLVIWVQGGLRAIGGSPRMWRAGIRKGWVWAVGLGMAAGVGMLLAYLSGHNLMVMIRQPLPSGLPDRLLFFFVGGLISPMAEEIFFRGIIYTFFRRWGIFVAMMVSTAIFVALHGVNGIPYTQIVGGLAFAVAYETSRNLMVPIIIHASGNLAIFALSLL